ncbi:crooked neck-like protein 1 [Patiria miniata]|uniref:Crooked neck-like protein 1 n=1 Tax=Patiria miniata TaxID=46514 RepID=A0A914B9X5_PATMI|nr:crooked neck-like protein 1 [Patiria miniata]
MASSTAKHKVPKVAKVKNRMPAEVQITAEQILREAKERELELVPPPPKQKITDPDELQEYRLRKRKEFEDNIRKNRSSVTNWIKYASWEESQREIDRARSVHERALDVDHRNITLWLKYAEMEMKHKQINHARNIWDRAITILPRAKQFWYKYTYMEEMIGNVAGARQVFERWMQWEPEEQAWLSFIKMELRYKEVDRARNIYERFVICHPEIKNWIRFASFEEHNNYVSSARKVFERAVEFFGEEHMDEKLYVAFSKFEERQKEHERARVIYKYALDKIPKQHAEDLFKSYTIHEKRYGDRAGIEDIIVSKRRFQYEEEVKANPSNYDAWFDYLRLLETDGNEDTVREIYERAIANVPPAQEKRLWRRYIYLWINYALYEELNAKDSERTRQVYKACLDMIPHKKFTFAKVWLMFAHFEIRQKNLSLARKILGAAIGKCPKDKLFKGYIELELQLREFDRCRILYQKFLEFNPENCTTWMKFTELEGILGDTDRARAVFDLAINQPKLDMPEVLWKAYIDFEIEQEEYERTRALYRCLLQRTQHVKVWISFAKFELSVGAEGCVERARCIYKDASKALRDSEEKEERLMLLEAWKDFEDECGDEESQAVVKKQMPNRVKRRRKIQTEDRSDAGWEEYYDYIFPNDESNLPNLKLLAMAKQWKLKQTDQDDEDEDRDGDEGTEETGTSDAQKEAEQFNDEDYDDSDDSSSSSSEEEDSKTSPRKDTSSKKKASSSSDSSDSDG